MRWDIFCKVIDNHGDAGVCWRLACALARTGDGADSVRLWIDDPAPLAWMAPAGCPGVQVIHWQDDDAAPALDAPPDVLIEAFGCDPAPATIAALARATGRDARKRHWINLEYLSAEPYVERLHTLPSPVFRGPGAGLTKYFFYPGFTPATGGLLREDDLPARRAGFNRTAWLAARAVPWQPGERLATLFSYEPAALATLVAHWRAGPVPTHLLVTPGRAAAALRALGLPEAGAGALRLSWLPHLPQEEFDHLLWCGDLNFVRGEDSLVRALWAGAPLVWQIYPQDDDAHHVKLDAFLDWLGAPPGLRRFHAAWNGIRSPQDLAWPDAAEQARWAAAVAAARAALLAQEDLVTRLRRFVAQKS